MKLWKQTDQQTHVMWIVIIIYNHNNNDQVLLPYKESTTLNSYKWVKTETKFSKNPFKEASPSDYA